MMLSIHRMLVLLSLAIQAQANDLPSGWSTWSPREEIQPRFAFLPTGGPGGDGSFVIESGSMPG